MIRAIAIFIFSAGLLSAGDVNWRLWAASVGVHAAGTSADAYSSWGQSEQNRLLCNARGQFGARGVSIKVGSLAVVTGLEYAILHVTHSRKAAQVFVGLNTVLGGGYGVVAITNMRAPGRIR